MTVLHKEEPVINLKGGFANKENEEHLDDHLIPVFSCSKVLESVVIAMLVDRKKLDYHAPIAAYWPEFAAEGKGTITVSTLMRHQAGLLGK